MKEKIYSLFAEQGDMPWEQILANIGVSALIGMFIFISYAISHRGTIYSKKFNASLVILQRTDSEEPRMGICWRFCGLRDLRHRHQKA